MAMAMENRNAAFKYISIAHLTRCVSDRSYAFFLPLFLSKQCSKHSTLRPTATLTIVQNLAVVFLSTMVAKKYLRPASEEKSGNEVSRRLGIFIKATLLENVAVALGGVFLMGYAASGKVSSDGDLTFNTDSNNSGGYDCNNPLASNHFRIALVCAAIDAVFSSLLSMIISKEWVAILSGTDQPVGKEKSRNDEGLAKANAFLSQIDLAVGTLSPIIISHAIQKVGYHQVLILLIGQHLLGALVIISAVRRAVSLVPELLVLKTGQGKSVHEWKDSRDKIVASAPKISFPQIFSSLPIRTRLITVAYALLYFTILSPGAMLNSWMNTLDDGDGQVKMNETMIAYTGSASQFCGVVATFLSPQLIRATKSLLVSSAISQWFQAACIIYGATCFYQLENNIHGLGAKSNSIILQFLIAISLSRIGLWAYDLVERQMLQESVPKHYQTLFFSGEKAITQMVSLAMMGLCYCFPDPNSFGILVYASLSAVFASSIFIGVSFWF